MSVSSIRGSPVPFAPRALHLAGGPIQLPARERLAPTFSAERPDGKPAHPTSGRVLPGSSARLCARRSRFLLWRRSRPRPAFRLPRLHPPGAPSGSARRKWTARPSGRRSIRAAASALLLDRSVRLGTIREGRRAAASERRAPIRRRFASPSRCCPSHEAAGAAADAGPCRLGDRPADEVRARQRHASRRHVALSRDRCRHEADALARGLGRFFRSGA